MLHRVISCLAFFLVFSISCATAANGGNRRNESNINAPLDSIAEKASILAARGQTAELRPIYYKMGQTFPASVRLYCEMALAQADLRWERVNDCIDSLTTTYAGSLNLKGLIALTLLKAETLHKLGRYADLRDYASERLRYYQSRQVKASLLSPFKALAQKGKRLSGTDSRTRMLQCVEQQDAARLLHEYGMAQIRALDDYARWRCMLLLAVAYNRQNLAIHTADSLLFHKADSLDANDYLSCVNAAAQACINRGDWKALNRLSTRLMQRKKSKLLWGRYLSLSKTFLHRDTTRTVRAKNSTVELELSPLWPPLTSVNIGGDYQAFCLTTGSPHTIITEEDARTSHVALSHDTVSLTSPIGLVKAVTAVADSLVLGPVSLHNVVIYVAVSENLQGDSTEIGMVRTLGLLDLARLGRVDLGTNVLRIYKDDEQPAMGPSEHANLHFTPHGALVMDEQAASRTRTWMLNTAFPDNMTGSHYWNQGDTDGEKVYFDIHVGSTLCPQVKLKKTADAAVEADGILAYPFMQQFGPLHIDFKNCTLRVSKSGESHNHN